MRIEFIKPAPGWAYSEGSIVDLPELKAKFLIDNGYARLTAQPDKHYSQLAVEKAIKKRQECSHAQ